MLEDHHLSVWLTNFRAGYLGFVNIWRNMVVYVWRNLLQLLNFLEYQVDFLKAYLIILMGRHTLLGVVWFHCVHPGELALCFGSWWPCMYVFLILNFYLKNLKCWCSDKCCWRIHHLCCYGVAGGSLTQNHAIIWLHKCSSNHHQCGDHASICSRGVLFPPFVLVNTSYQFLFTNHVCTCIFSKLQSVGLFLWSLESVCAM